MDGIECRARAAACRAHAERFDGILRDDFLWAAESWEALAQHLDANAAAEPFPTREWHVEMTAASAPRVQASCNCALRE